MIRDEGKALVRLDLDWKSVLLCMSVFERLTMVYRKRQKSLSLCELDLQTLSHALSISNSRGLPFASTLKGIVPTGKSICAPSSSRRHTLSLIH
jgi:hypothetical protein